MNVILKLIYFIDKINKIVYKLKLFTLNSTRRFEAMDFLIFLRYFKMKFKLKENKIKQK